MITEFVITAGESRKRLDHFLVHREPQISRSGIQRLIQLGRIRVNARPVKPGRKVKSGDRITIDPPEPQRLVVEGHPVPLDVVYEDDWLIVVNKPPGVVVHPTSGHWSGTLMNALLAHFHSGENRPRSQALAIRPGLVHRLDKETSGVMVVAKTSEAHRKMAGLFERQAISRVYQALVLGIPNEDHGVITRSIGRDRRYSKNFSVDGIDAKSAVTEYGVLQPLGSVASLVRLIPRTGRTHQLRLHMAAIGCPILGDATYGGERVCRIGTMAIRRGMLHAHTLGFQHPYSQEYHEFSASVPADMQSVLTVLLPPHT